MSGWLEASSVETPCQQSSGRFRLIIGLWHITVDLRVDREGAIDGVARQPCEFGKTAAHATRRSAKSQAVEDLSIGARSGSPHHSATAQQ